MPTLIDRINAWSKWDPPVGFDERKGHVAPEPVTLQECAERIAELEAALGAILDHHGPGTLGTEEIYEQAATALYGPRPNSNEH